MDRHDTRVDADSLANWLTDGDEIAILDAREQGVFLHRHLFHASCLPLSHLELRLPSLVPRRTTRVVWCDDGADHDGGLAERARDRAGELGWTGGYVLDGGLAAWASSGREVYAGVNVPSKAFGEHVEHAFGTPRLTADEVHARIERGENVVVLDSRPIEEFRRMSIPTGTDCPGAELVHRVKEVVTDPDSLVVVNCAGRTRSIIGCQSLINAGLENQVVALENGTMGWELAGYDVVRGSETHAPDPGDDARCWSAAAAAAVGRRFGVVHIDHDRLVSWQAEPDRTTFLLDVRSPAEYDAGHLSGSIAAPGGQLVQATDEYVATRNARLVLVDDDGVRATMTASWLRQMGWGDAVVLDRAFVDRPLEPATPPWPPVAAVPTIDVVELADRLCDGGAETVSKGRQPITVLDLASSLEYRNRGHVPGAWWGVRSRLGEARARVGDASTLVLTSTDGRLAALAAPEAVVLWPEAEVAALDGGNTAWRGADQETELGFTRPTTEADDVWYKPYDHHGDAVEQHMRDYLTWEIALVEQLARDDTVRFPVFP